MTGTKSSGRPVPPPGRFRRLLPMLVLTLLVLALAVPAAVTAAPGFAGPPPPPEPAAAGPWQLPPATLGARPAAGSGTSGAAMRPLSEAAPVPDAAALAAQLSATLKTDGAGSFTGMVQDAATGEVLFNRSGDEVRAPASNIKLLTAAAALRALGPDRRFSTRVVAGPAPGTVILAGGGDVLLGAGKSAPDAVMGHAGLATLAQSTIDALQRQGVTGPVTVLLDDSLFSGPSLNPAWDPADVAAGEIAPVFALALNSARFAPGSTTGSRPRDAAMSAAETFAARLGEAGAAAGLTVAPGVARVTPAQKVPAAGDPGAKVLAAVDSATVSQQADLLLRTSDNYLAEVLGRMVAAAGGQPASYDAAIAAVLQQLKDLDMPAATLHAADLAGLTLENRVSARQLTDVVRAMTVGADTRLRSALAGFPVAGLTGTLNGRYTDAGTTRGAGVVRAKTGTLNTVIALSGYVVDADGRLLVFSFIGNGLTPGAAGNTVALDRTASVLAACGCR